jgi:His-Xaa-Ser system protein HxsD
MAKDPASPMSDEPGWSWLKLQKSLYSQDAVLKAIYRFTDRAFVDIQQGDDIWEVGLRPKQASADPQVLLAELRNEAVDQQLRETVAIETRAVRDLILTHALSQANLIDPELEGVDSRTDPLGIAQPDKLASRRK